MPQISMLIKPVSSLCNLKCKYCFYHDEAEKRIINNYGIMQIDTLEIIVKKAFDEASNCVTFSFQGGEPTLAGLTFFEALIEFVKKYNVKNIKVSYSMQTNGMVVDSEWAKFFFENKFLIGLSLDGIKEIHDLNRIDANGKGSFQQVLNVTKILDKYKVEYNILTVINAHTSRHITKIYSFYKKQGFKYMQFIPCLDPINEEPFQQDWSLTPERYLMYMKTIFDLWYNDNIKNNVISVRHLDNYLGIFLGYAPESCGMTGMCSVQNVIEADGSIYPCDFYVLDDYKLGNILEKSFKEIFECEKSQGFMKNSCNHSQKCKACKWYKICRNGCHRHYFNGDYTYCDETIKFFDYSYERFLKLAKVITPYEQSE